MNDKKIIVIGLIIFLIIILFPVWYNVARGRATYDVEADLQMPGPEHGKRCVMETRKMRESHMDLLNDWRDRVVRKGQRIYTDEETGAKYEMSLTHTCLKCHDNREQFCNVCHDYMGVKPYCWDCHVDTAVVSLKVGQASVPADIEGATE